MQIKAHVVSSGHSDIWDIHRQFVFPQFIVHNWREISHHLICPGYINLFHSCPHTELSDMFGKSLVPGRHLFLIC